MLVFIIPLSRQSFREVHYTHTHSLHQKHQKSIRKKSSHLLWCVCVCVWFVLCAAAILRHTHKPNHYTVVTSKWKTNKRKLLFSSSMHKGMLRALSSHLSFLWQKIYNTKNMWSLPRRRHRTTDKTNKQKQCLVGSKSFANIVKCRRYSFILLYEVRGMFEWILFVCDG